jgi:hypothetical protein
MLTQLVDNYPLSAILANLGNTADQVAETIKVHGTQGVRNTVRFLNPLIRYLQTQTHHHTFSMDLILGDRLRIRLDDGTWEEALLPEPVLQFLEAFNRGVYAELVLP